MSKVDEILSNLANAKIIAVVRAADKVQANKIAIACRDGGIKAVEITYTVPNATAVLSSLAESPVANDVLLGVGTVLDAGTALEAINAGAKYIVSPGFDAATCNICNQQQIPYIPGCMTVTEILTAHAAGASAIKLFPASFLTTGFLKAIKGVLPAMSFIATGGVNLTNCLEWLRAGCSAVGVGGELTLGAKTGHYHLVTETAQKFIMKLQEL